MLVHNLRLFVETFESQQSQNNIEIPCRESPIPRDSCSSISTSGCLLFNSYEKYNVPLFPNKAIIVQNSPFSSVSMQIRQSAFRKFKLSQLVRFAGFRKSIGKNSASVHHHRWSEESNAKTQAFFSNKSRTVQFSIYFFFSQMRWILFRFRFEMCSARTANSVKCIKMVFSRKSTLYEHCFL